MKTPTWKSIGAWHGGTVIALAAEGDLALAATRAGLYRSSDAGETWQFASASIADPITRCVVIAPGATQAFAATQDARLHHSKDGGQTWREVKGWAGIGAINALAIAPDFAKSQTLFAATDGGAYRSFDGGASWQSADFGLLDGELICLAVAPDFADSETLWAGGASGGLVRSRNSARAWRDSGHGLADSAVQCMQVSPNFAEDKTLWVGLEDGGVFVSRDAATTWASVGLTTLSVHGLHWHAGSLWACSDDGVWRLGGARWVQTGLKGSTVFGLASSGPRLLAGSYESGLFVSDDGKTWRASNLGLCARVPPEAVHNASHGLLLRADEGVMRSVDGGRTFAALKNSPQSFAPLLSKGSVVHLGRHPALPGHWHAVLADNVLRESVNDGKSWRNAAAPPQSGVFTQMIITADGARHVVAANAEAVVDDEAQTYALQLWRLEPAKEAEWAVLTTLAGAHVPQLALLSTADALFIGAQHSITRIARDAKGRLMTRVSELPSGSNITALHAADGLLLAATNRGVLASSDDGKKWKPHGLTGRAVVALLDVDGVLTAVTLGGEVWRL